jgi:serine-type D-Ala-D-Ala carboxypeptidase (penicillin-binding protein 5/6)
MCYNPGVFFTNGYFNSINRIMYRKICLFLIALLYAVLIVNPVAAQTPAPTVTPTPTPPVNLPPPVLTARAAIALDADTGQILYAKNMYAGLPMASITKIMTALTLFSIPGVNLEDGYTVVHEDRISEKSMGLWFGQRVKVKQLLYGMLLDSANDAATALARYGGRKLSATSLDPVDSFVARMNALAAQLGVRNTHFANPHGLDDPQHYTSAYDLALLGWHALQNPQIASIVRQNILNDGGFSFLNESNFIRRYPGATGIKPGETDKAGLCIVASAYRFGHNAIIVLLRSPGMRTESDKLMDYAYSEMLSQTPNRNPNLPVIPLPAKNSAGLFTLSDISQLPLVNSPKQPGLCLGLFCLYPQV